MSRSFQVGAPLTITYNFLAEQSTELREPDVAVVTGAGGGIGLAVCRRLATDGWAVGALDVDEDGARRAAECARLAGAVAEHCRCDVTDEVSVGRAVGTLAERLGRPRALVNNAGILGPGGRRSQRRCAATSSVCSR